MIIENDLIHTGVDGFGLLLSSLKHPNCSIIPQGHCNKFKYYNSIKFAQVLGYSIN